MATRLISSRAALAPSRALVASAPVRRLLPVQIPRLDARHGAALHTSAPVLQPHNYGVASTGLYGGGSPSLGGLGGGSVYGGSAMPPSAYFAKPSLPANTIIRFVPQQTA